MRQPHIAIGNGELDDNRRLVSGESIPCRNCSTMCVIKSHNFEKSEVSIQTTKCFKCGKTYMVGMNSLSLWEKKK
jgi:dissimilatory sulfite reductase (desulfoviridin) alpha/beta subunit